MTYPRSHLIEPSGGVYHLSSRCVRRAFLCGTDAVTGRNYAHRKQWLENRILALAEIFAVDLFGYAVMDNHYHMVVRLDPSQSTTWSDEDVADRWLALSPQRSNDPEAEQHAAMRKDTILKDAQLLQTYRDRLCSISWLMRYINEPLARLSNAEDDCKGRFWESRFVSQRLLDENAVLACMVYVDLNPVRAGIADDATEARHTSLAHRIAQDQDQGRGRAQLRPVNASHEPLPVDCTLEDYISLVRWTVVAQQSTRPSRPSRLIGVSAELWLHHYLPKPKCWQRALGSAEHLRAYARQLGQRWIRCRAGRSPALES